MTTPHCNNNTTSWQQQCDNGQSNDQHNNIRWHNKRRGASPWLMYLSSRLHSVQCIWPSHPPVVGFWPPKPCTNPYPTPEIPLPMERVKVSVKTPMGYLCPSLSARQVEAATSSLFSLNLSSIFFLHSVLTALVSFFKFLTWRSCCRVMSSA